MARDFVYKLCLETDESTHYLADIQLSHIDYSIYFEFKDRLKTQLHIHTTGRINIKNNGQRIQTIQIVDPLTINGLLPIASYSISDLLAYPPAEQLNPDEILLIPKEVTCVTSRLAFALSRIPMMIPNIYSVSVSLPEILTINIAALSNPAPPSIYEPGANPLCSLTKNNLSAVPIDQALRFIENNEILRSVMNPETPILSAQEIYFPPLMLRAPNSLGVWELIFEVSMRDVPEFNMQFIDSRFQVEDCETTKKAFNKVSRKFRVLDSQTNECLFENLPPFELILNAEL